MYQYCITWHPNDDAQGELVVTVRSSNVCDRSWADRLEDTIQPRLIDLLGSDLRTIEFVTC